MVMDRHMGDSDILMEVFTRAEVFIMEAVFIMEEWGFITGGIIIDFKEGDKYLFFIDFKWYAFLIGFT